MLADTDGLEEVAQRLIQLKHGNIIDINQLIVDFEFLEAHEFRVMKGKRVLMHSGAALVRRIVQDLLDGTALQGNALVKLLEGIIGLQAISMDDNLLLRFAALSSRIDHANAADYATALMRCLANVKNGGRGKTESHVYITFSSMLERLVSEGHTQVAREVVRSVQVVLYSKHGPGCITGKAFGSPSGILTIILALHCADYRPLLRLINLAADARMSYEGMQQRSDAIDGMMDEIFGQTERQLHILVDLLEEHDEIAIMTLAEGLMAIPNIECMNETIARTMQRLLDQKLSAVTAIFDRLLWPVTESRLRIASGLTFSETTVTMILLDHIRLLIDINRQDAVMGFLAGFPEIASRCIVSLEFEPIPALLAKVAQFDHTREWTFAHVSDVKWDEFALELLKLRTCSRTGVEMCFEKLRNIVAGEQVAQWKGLFAETKPIVVNPFYLLRYLLNCHDAIPLLDSLSVFLTSQAEFPNDPIKIALAVNAFSLSIEYWALKLKLKLKLDTGSTDSKDLARLGKLVKRRQLLVSKIASTGFRDIPLTAECLVYLMECLIGQPEEEHLHNLIFEQLDTYNTHLTLTISNGLYQRLPDKIKIAVLKYYSVQATFPADRRNVDLIIALFECAARNNQTISPSSSLKGMECDNHRKLVRLLELALDSKSTDTKSFLDDLIHDLTVVFGKIEESRAEAAPIDSEPIYKFSHERNGPVVLATILRHLEKEQLAADRFLKTVRKDDRLQIQECLSLLHNSLLSLAQILHSICSIAVDGTGWERLVALLIRFYKTAINLLRSFIHCKIPVDEQLIVAVSSRLTRSLYLLIPVAHQLDHEKMKELYKLDKHKKVKKQSLSSQDKHVTKKGRLEQKLDSKLAKEATRLPQLIFLIETFDCLVVRLSRLQNETLVRHIYKSTARDFRIQMDELEAALAALDNDDDNDASVNESN